MDHGDVLRGRNPMLILSSPWREGKPSVKPKHLQAFRGPSQAQMDTGPCWASPSTPSKASTITPSKSRWHAGPGRLGPRDYGNMLAERAQGGHRVKKGTDTNVATGC